MFAPTHTCCAGGIALLDHRIELAKRPSGDTISDTTFFLLFLRDLIVHLSYWFTTRNSARRSGLERESPTVTASSRMCGAHYNEGQVDVRRIHLWSLAAAAPPPF